MSAPAAVPANADQNRAAYFKELVTGRAAVYAMVFGGGALFLWGAYLYDPRIWVGGPVAMVVLVVLLAFRAADKQAQRQFFLELARSLGLDYATYGEVPPLTPLLGGGDRRRMQHVMTGFLGPSEDEARVPMEMGLYTYETRHKYGDASGSGDAVAEAWDPHRFTVCVFDIGGELSRMRGVFVRRRRGVFEPDSDWLHRLDPRMSETESTAFNVAYEVLLARDQDPIAARQLLSPSLLDWFARHPLVPGMELRAGTLVVFLPGHVEEAGKLTWFLEGARELARRVIKDGAEAPTLPAGANSNR